MAELRGKSVFEGIAIGRIKVIKHADNKVVKRSITDTSAEMERFEIAAEKAAAQLDELYTKTLSEVGEESADIFSIHKMMTQDDDLKDLVSEKINSDLVCAEYAVEEAGYELSQMFVRMQDEYMRARAVDVLDVAKRISGLIMGGEETETILTQPVILAASELTPSEIMKLDKSKILGFVTTFGSANSHTAILARTMSLPSVVDVRERIKDDIDGETAIVDGFEGRVIIQPDAKTLADYTEKMEELNSTKRELAKYANLPTLTKDGRKVNLYANIGAAYETEFALSNSAEGIGLFRSEFLYLESDDYPKEDYQYYQYKKVVTDMAGKSVIFRTMDIGADKKVGYFNLPDEENPALGFRSIRICMTRPEILKTQLRALYRASAFGKLMIMVPMIISVDEVRFVKELATEVQNELKIEGIAFDSDVPIGIMIETPAAAMIADELAKEVDFFSIGTNDLTQYTLAIDRQNESLGEFYNPCHKSVFRLIDRVVDCAHKAGIWAGVCGELARNEEALPFLLASGIDELSVSPPYVLSLRKQISEIDVSKLDKKDFI